MTHVEQEEGGWQRHTNASTAASFHFSSQTQLDSSTSKTSAKKPAATSLSSMTPPIVGGFNAKFQDTAAIDAMEIDILRKRLSEVAAERHQISIELTRARQMTAFLKAQVMEFAPLNPKLQVAVENYIEMIRALELQVKSSPLLETILDKLVRTKSYLQLAQSTIAEFELGAQGLLSSSDCTGASPQVTPALSDGNDNSVSSHGVSSTSLITAAVNRVPSDSQEDFSIVKKLSSGAATSPPSLRNKNLKQAVKTLKAKPYTSPELDILRGFELFKSFPEECLTRVSRWAMEIRKASGDVIVSRGDQSHELFFLVDGRVVVLDANGDEISSLGMGSFFGEIGFLFHVNRTATVRAKTDCQLLVITYQKYEETLQLYPDLRTETDRFTRNKEEWFKHQNYKGNDSFGAEFVGSIARSSLMKLDIFTNLDVSFIEQLSMSMHGERHPAGARVIEAGEEANCMYFIMTGTVEVVGMSDQVHAEIGEGSFFGEVGILFEVKRTASIRCKTECTLLKLTKENLNKVSKEYPDISEKIKREADERHKLYIARASQRRNSTELFDIEVNEQNLKKIRLFSHLESNILSELAVLMCRRVYNLGEFIITAGARADSMFFLAVGEVEVVTEFGEVIDQAKGPNAWFGEVGILEGLPRTATIKPTSATCSVFELKKSDVKELMVKYPEIGDKIVESSQERLQKYLMRSILA